MFLKLKGITTVCFGDIKMLDAVNTDRNSQVASVALHSLETAIVMHHVQKDAVEEKRELEAKTGNEHHNENTATNAVNENQNEAAGNPELGGSGTAHSLDIFV